MKLQIRDYRILKSSYIRYDIDMRKYLIRGGVVDSRAQSINKDNLYPTKNAQIIVQ